VRAFVGGDGEDRLVDPGLVAIALVVAPVVFVAVGVVSRSPNWVKRTLVSFGLLLALGLALGLFDPALGAAAGFGVGIAVTLNMPDIAGQLRRRLAGVAFAVAYMLVMLLLINPAGVLAGAVLPGLMVGFADEYGAWRTNRLTEH